jgi:hypothetical protein
MSGWDKTIRFIEFSGDEADWRVWSCKYLARAHMAGQKDLLLGKVVSPPDDLEIDEESKEGQELLRLRELNTNAYSTLLLSCNGMAFGCVEEARTEKHPEGDAYQAMKNLFEKYQAETMAEKVELKRDFAKAKMTSGTMDPDVWFVELEYLKQRLRSMDCILSEEDMIAHVLSNLHGNYGELVTSLEGDLESLTFNKLHEHVRGFYRCCIKNDKEKEKDEIALVSNQHKGHCKNCGCIGHKTEKCYSKGKSSSNDRGGNEPSTKKENKYYETRKYYNCNIMGH